MNSGDVILATLASTRAELAEARKVIAETRRVIADQRVQLNSLRARVVYEEDVQLEGLEVAA